MRYQLIINRDFTKFILDDCDFEILLNLERDGVGVRVEVRVRVEG